MPPPAHDAASYILCTPSQAGTPTTTSKTHTHTTMKHLPVQQQQTAKHCIPHDFLFLINVIPEIREGDQCCALKFMGKNGNKIFFSLPLSLAPSFPLPLAPLTLPSFSFPHLSAHTRAHTHSFFFITRVHSPSRSISNPPTGSSFSASPLLSFILYSLPPPSLPPSPPLRPISIPPFHVSPVTPSIHPFIRACMAGRPSGSSVCAIGRATEPLWHSAVAQQPRRPGFRPAKFIYRGERL